MATDRSIYFFLIPHGVSRDNYAHNALVLAEGLHELGWKIHANIDYWRSGPDATEFLFKHDADVRPADCAVNVLTYDWMHFVNVLPFELVENSKSYRVYLEDAGWLKTPGLSKDFAFFDVVLKAHFNDRCAYPRNFRPWAFGLSQRILRETDAGRRAERRIRRLLVNFGATHSSRHPLRELCERKLYPKLEGMLDIDRTMTDASVPPVDSYHRLMWEQTAKRHDPDYYGRLNDSAACAGFGGQLISPTPADWSPLAGYGKRVKLRRHYHEFMGRLGSRAKRCNQWESWRFWETLAAGAAPFMVDFEKYGIRLPEQPRNWVHYIGFDLDDVDAGVDAIAKQPELLASVGRQGRDWARDNYGPVATAKRFLRDSGLE